MSAASPTTTAIRSLLPRGVAGQRQALADGDARARVAAVEHVVGALGAPREATHAAELAEGPERQAAGQQLVGVGLVAGVPDDAVGGAVEQPMEHHRQLHHAQRAAQVAAGLGDGADDGLADLVAQLRQLGVARPRRSAGPRRVGRMAKRWAPLADSACHRVDARRRSTLWRGRILRARRRAAGRAARRRPPDALDEALDPQLGAVRSRGAVGMEARRPARRARSTPRAAAPGLQPRHHRLELRERLVEGHRGDGSASAAVAARRRVSVMPPSLARARRARPARRAPGGRRARRPSATVAASGRSPVGRRARWRSPLERGERAQRGEAAPRRSRSVRARARRPRGASAGRSVEPLEPRRVASSRAVMARVARSSRKPDPLAFRGEVGAAAARPRAPVARRRARPRRRPTSASDAAASSRRRGPQPARPGRPVEGTASSAATDGVAARTSAANSASVTSVSWPTPTMTGHGKAATARTTPPR